MVQPRCAMERSDSVDFVSGKKKAAGFSNGCIPSIGQMIPQSMMRGKKEPSAMYVALRSLSTAHEITKPKSNDKQNVSVDGSR